MAKDKDKDNENPRRGISRREFIKTAGSAGGVLTLGPRAVSGGTGFGTQPSADASRPYNIVFILTDQERYFDPATLPDGYSLPGRERLEREGVTFTNHQIASSVCSSSRSVIYTGQHIQHTRVFDKHGLPLVQQHVAGHAHRRQLFE